jgi:hypothetical protein
MIIFALNIYKDFETQLFQTTIGFYESASNYEDEKSWITYFLVPFLILFQVNYYYLFCSLQQRFRL